MSELFILVALGLGLLVAVTVVFALLRLIARITTTWRLRSDRALSYTWRRAWRAAGFHLLH